MSLKNFFIFYELELNNWSQKINYTYFLLNMFASWIFKKKYQWFILHTIILQFFIIIKHNIVMRKYFINLSTDKSLICWQWSWYLKFKLVWGLIPYSSSLFLSCGDMGERSSSWISSCDFSTFLYGAADLKPSSTNVLSFMEICCAWYTISYFLNSFLSVHTFRKIPQNSMREPIDLNFRRHMV